MAHYGGYIDSRKLVGDHIGLCIDILQADLIGLYQHKIIPSLSSHLLLDEPYTVRMFNTALYHSLI